MMFATWFNHKEESTMTTDESDQSRRPPMNDEIKKILTCPISLEYMKDPVTLVQSGQTYDRESLCACLLSNPTLCPSSNQSFREKLQYVPNMTARQLLMVYIGNDAYQPYNDSKFKIKYEARWRKREIESEDAEKLFMLGQYQYHDRQDYELAKYFYERAAQQGHAAAQFNLGSMYYHALGVKQDYQRAKHLFESSADQGFADAQYNLGILYGCGQGVTQDYEWSGHYFALAAERNDADAQYTLGVMYSNGIGVEKDYKRARHYYTLAANQGKSSAQFNLGSMYYHALGVKQDYTMASYYYRKAAGQGHVKAHTNLGIIFHLGHGAAQDDGMAKRYYKVAAAQGCTTAKNNLEKLKRARLAARSNKHWLTFWQ